MDKLSDELHNMLDVQKLFNIYFRAAIRIPISEWPSEKKERMIQAARSKGFNVDAI